MTFDDAAKSQLISGSSVVETSSSTSKQFVLCRDSSEDDEVSIDDGNDGKIDDDGQDVYNNDNSMEQLEDLKSYKLKCEENEELKKQIATLQQQLTLLPSKQLFKSMHFLLKKW
jgi:hypothetical protein